MYQNSDHHRIFLTKIDKLIWYKIKKKFNSEPVKVPNRNAHDTILQ